MNDGDLIGFNTLIKLKLAIILIQTKADYNIKTIDIKAVVKSGRGLASSKRSNEIMNLSMLKGLSLIDGSLNLVTSKPIWLDTRYAFYSSVSGHFYWSAYIEGIPVVLNRWIICPTHIYEIFSEQHLRTVLNLKDNDKVTLSIPSKIINFKETANLKNQLIWYAVWFGRTSLYYKSDRYLTWLRRFNKYVWRYQQRKS